MSKKKQKKKNPALISYITLRKTVGILGITFPIILVLGSVVAGSCRDIQSSISAYYHTNMHDLFVGILCSIALFLFAYKGYNKADSISGILAGIFALGVAFFPASITSPLSKCLPNPIDTHLLNSIHFISAACLFLVLAYFSIYLFTKSEKNPTHMKLKRNKLYRICGYIMLGCVVLIAIISVVKTFYNTRFLEHYNPIFWLEAVALWAFGLSWLTKGKTIYLDK